MGGVARAVRGMSPRSPGDWGRTRAQSEVVGNVLLVATIVIAVSVAGGVYVSTIGDDEETYVDVTVSVADPGVSQVVFTHQGGDAVRDSTLVVRVWVNDAQASPVLNTSASTGTADGRFGPGEQRVYDVTAMDDGDTVRALLATNGTNTVLVDDRLTFES